MTVRVAVELDQWDRRGEMRAEFLEDDSQIILGFASTRNDKIVFDRSIQLGDYLFRVFVEEHRGETFFVRAAMAVGTSRRKLSKRLRKSALRERPLTPSYTEEGDVYWTLDRTGVFSGFPAQWNDYWANNFIKETLDGLRSPQIPRHFELHQDNEEIL